MATVADGSLVICQLFQNRPKLSSDMLEEFILGFFVFGLRRIVVQK